MVRRVKAVLGKACVRKVGHAGTLDPFASGLLIILLDQGTKLFPFLMAQKKTYLATIRLGVETDTLDLTGRVVRRREILPLTGEEIRAKAECFIGRIQQTPPAYSAVKLQGVRAYELVRKWLPVALKTRTVNVYDLRILEYTSPHITFEVSCSSGTYIRSLADDLARALGPGGHLTSLRRLGSGSFQVRDALSSKEILPQKTAMLTGERMMTLADALPGIPTLDVAPELAEKIRHGHQPAWEQVSRGSKSLPDENGLIKLVSRHALVAVLRIQKDQTDPQTKVHIERVFV